MRKRIAESAELVAGSLADKYGRRAVTRRYKCNSGHPSLVVLFLPGNPGVLDVYDPFMRSLHALDPDSIEVTAISHIGHDSAIPLPLTEAFRLRGPPLANLQDNTDLEITFLEQIIDEFGAKVPIVAIGHSVGGFLATKLMAARPQQISSVYALFPSLSHLAQSRGGRRLTPLLAGIGTPIILLFQLLFSFLPYAVILTLVGWFVPMRSEVGRRGLARFVAQPACLAACIALAHDEFLKIAEVDKAFLEKYSSRTSFYWASGDVDLYVPDKDVQEIVTILEHVAPERKARRLRCERGMRHAFSLQTSDQMAEIVCRWLSEDFKVG